METITRKDNRIASLFEALENSINKVNCLTIDYKPPFNNERYITDEELSNRLNIHRRTLNDYRKYGNISYTKFGGKVMYKESDVQKMLDEAYVEAWRK